MAKIHPTAIVEEGVTIGEGSSVWDNVHIRHDTVIGEQCIIGGKSVIAYEVKIGNRVKINSNVYICYGVELEDGVMISAHTVFTNDRFPRATTPDLTELRDSDPDEETLSTRVREGTTVGANATIGPGITLGRFSMIGMGSVVTRSVPDFHLVVGSPARSIGAVCRCGEPIARFNGDDPEERIVHCEKCGRQYGIAGRKVSELGV